MNERVFSTAVIIVARQSYLQARQSGRQILNCAVFFEAFNSDWPPVRGDFPPIGDPARQTHHRLAYPAASGSSGSRRPPSRSCQASSTTAWKSCWSCAGRSARHHLFPQPFGSSRRSSDRRFRPMPALRCWSAGRIPWCRRGIHRLQHRVGCGHRRPGISTRQIDELLSASSCHISSSQDGSYAALEANKLEPNPFLESSPLYRYTPRGSSYWIARCVQFSDADHRPAGAMSLTFRHPRTFRPQSLRCRASVRRING
jgi:hypothetical protein